MAKEEARSSWGAQESALSVIHTGSDSLYQVTRSHLSAHSLHRFSLLVVPYSLQLSSFATVS